MTDTDAGQSIVFNFDTLKVESGSVFFTWIFPIMLYVKAQNISPLSIKIKAQAVPNQKFWRAFFNIFYEHIRENIPHQNLVVIDVENNPHAVSQIANLGHYVRLTFFDEGFQQTIADIADILSARPDND